MNLGIITVACFAFVFLLSARWSGSDGTPPTASGWSSRSPSSPTSFTRCFGGSSSSDGHGIAQIVVYPVVLTALAYPLGTYMARVYARALRRAALARALERGFYRLVRTDPTASRTGRATPMRVVFSSSSSALLYAILRCRRTCRSTRTTCRTSAHIALNTTASFVTNTNWQYYGGEYTMSYLSQMAGLAVQNFVSAAVGMAVLVAVVRGFARRSTPSSATSGSTSTARSSTSCCRWPSSSG